MTLAREIDSHLRRFEADPKINSPRETHGGLQPFWKACAIPIAGRIHVIYVLFQGGTFLTIQEARLYLSKLNDGFVGRHFEALQ